MRFVYLYAIYQCIRGLFRYSSNVKNEIKAKEEAAKQTNPIFYIKYSKKRLCVYDIYYDRFENLTYYVKDKDEIFNIPAFDCKFDGFCAGGKKELAEMLNGVRMSKDRMDELRYLCNATGLSEEEQEEIREIIKFPQKLTTNSEKW